MVEGVSAFADDVRCRRFPVPVPEHGYELAFAEHQLLGEALGPAR